MTDSGSITIRNDMDVDLIQRAGWDTSIALAAWVSTGADAEESRDRQAGLINFLMRDRHGTPFEHNSMTFRISAPIFVFREFHRHRAGWSYNEESGRYKELEPVFYVPAPDRPLVQEGKPGAYTYVTGTEEQHRRTVRRLSETYGQAYANYRAMLGDGVAREVARSALPVGIYSTMWATCNARSLMHFLSLRRKTEQTTVPTFPQREIEMVAEQMETIFERLFPITHAAFNKHGRVAP